MNGKLYINGEFVNAHNNETFDVINPYTLQKIGKQANATTIDVKTAIDASADAFESYKTVSPFYRAKSLRKLYDLLTSNIDDIAKTITLEQGKPLNDAKAEVKYASSYIQWYAEEGLRVKGDILPSVHKNYHVHIKRMPVGPVAIITPWNFPLAMFVRKLAPALAAGCTAIVKPSSLTPLTAMKFFQLIDQAEFPKGVCQLLTGDAKLIGDSLLDDFRIRKISFTGSTKVGQMIARDAAKTMKRASMELGGHAPYIVTAHADLNRAVKGLIVAKYKNSGQVCIAANRLYVHKDVKDAFVTQLLDAISSLTIGNGLDGVDVGPMINKESTDKLSRHIDDAVKQGATCLIGGKAFRADNNGGYMFEPTLLDCPNENMLIAKEESFGPILPLFTFDDIDDVISRANNTPFGLSAYIFTNDLNEFTKLTECLNFGMVAANTYSLSGANAPFGGIKMSGYGREGGSYGMDEYLDYKYIDAKMTY